MLNAEKTTWCSKERYVEICHLWARTPELLSDDDLAELLHPDPAREKQARADRERARARAANPPAPAPVAATPVTPVVADISHSLAAANDFILKAFDPDPDPAFDRIAFAAEVRARRRSESFTPGYDPVAFLVASRQFHVHPAGLTDEDLTQLSLVDPDLGDQARAARTGYEKRDYVDDHAAALGQMPVSLLTLLKYVGEVRDSLQLFVDTVLYRVREAHARLAELERARLVDPKDAQGPLRTTSITAAPHTAPAGSTEDAGLAVRSVPSSPVTRDLRLEVLEAAVAEIKAENVQLKTQVVELSAKPGIVYKGVWQGDDTTYFAGDCVTKHGSMWIAKLNHLQSEPGKDFVGWQLAVKRGSDGKDLRR